MHRIADMAANPYFVLALAIASGLIGQVLAVHVGLPGIVILLAIGVLLGPDVAGWLDPASLGDALHGVVSFAVAIILFEGGLRLDLKRLRREQKPIRRLVTVGVLVTAVSAALVAKLCLGWSWRLCFLFGSLIVVTGPTVVTPLLHRLRAKTTVSTILEAEGVMIDAVGAIFAVVMLEFVLQPTGQNVLVGVWQVTSRLAFGIGLGIAAGWLIVALWRFRSLIPEGLENIVTLGCVLLLFQSSNAWLHESGLAAASVAGVVVGSAAPRARQSLLEFKEQLAALFIGTLFVLLAADVRLADVQRLGWGGVMTVIGVILLVRPLNVFLSTYGTELQRKEIIFIAWIGPRGIVAAAVASLFADELSSAGLPGGEILRALVFLVITVTVLSAGLTGGFVARLLDLQRKRNFGWALVGANPVARLLAQLLVRNNQEVVCIENNPKICRDAEAEGLRCVYGNALQPRTLQRAELDIRRGLVVCTPNEEVNLLVSVNARRTAKDSQRMAAISGLDTGVTLDMLKGARTELLFGSAVDIELWSSRLRQQSARFDWWRVSKGASPNWPFARDQIRAPALGLAVHRKGTVTPLTDKTSIKAGDDVAVLSSTAAYGEVAKRLRDSGWQPSSAEALLLLPKPVHGLPAHAVA